MTPALLLVRDCIIYSVNVWLVPVECAFNLIESELVRKGASSFTRLNSAPPDGASAIDPKSMNHSPCDWREKRGHLDAAFEIETEATCHTHQAKQPTSGPRSRRRDFSAGAGRCEQEIRSVYACARLSRSSNSAAGLFSVGRRGVARAAVCSRFPATRASAKQAHRIAFYAATDPDHLRSEATGSSCHRDQPARLPDCCSRARSLPWPPRRRPVLTWPMRYDDRPRHCPSKPMRVTGTPQSRPVSVKRWRS
jgi:hypothetical protein